MGNIKTLQRHGKTDTGFGLIDNLTYNTYSGNQVTKISDAVTPGPLYAGAFHFMDGSNTAVEYLYDKNGNLTKDYNKKIVDIRYNSLNLPDGLQFTNGNTIGYTYNAAGKKLSVTHQTAKAGVVIPMTNVMTALAPVNVLATTKTDYCGNVIYENGAISRILTEESYITLSGATPVYHYYLKDHQGNNRVVLNQNGTVEQINHYYPFGGLFGESTAGGVQPYKYNGKELDRMHGLDWFDYGARHYNAALGIWGTMDPLAEKYYSISPYAYVANNPVNLIDPTGMSYDWFQSGSGATLWRDSQDKQISIGGETFKNIGKAVSFQMMDGSYLNYFDNVALSVSSAPVNTWSKVLNNDGLRGELLSRSSPLAESSKVSLFQASINKGRQDFIDHPLTQMTINALLFAATGGLDIAPAAAGRMAAQGVGKSGAVISRSVGAAPRGFSTVLQSGGQALKANTLKILNLTKEQGRNAIHGLKSELGLPNNFHGKIMGNGDYIHPSTGKVLGNLLDYVH